MKVAYVLVGMMAMFVLGIFMVSASSNSTPPPGDDMAEIKRVMSENYLIGMQIKCLPEPLTKAQQDYLASGTEYLTQRYVLALASNGPCLDRALRTCEKNFPGQCVAISGEVRGKRP